MLQLFVQHIEAFFGQEIREISCKAILDSERALMPLRWSKLDVGIDEDPGGKNRKTVAPGRPVTRKST